MTRGSSRADRKPLTFRANLPGQGLYEIELEGDRIGRVNHRGEEDPAIPCCAAGLVDIQINGFAGVSFSSPRLKVDNLAGVLPAIWATGVTSFCPTLVTNTATVIERNFGVLEDARRSVPDFDASVPCYHLEGPFLSAGASSGAHDARLMCDPDWDSFLRWQEAAGGRIGIVTLAPERPGALEFIRRLREAGVIAAVSHTDGTREQVHAAASAGARLSTHLGNGCPQLLDRHGAPFWAQLADDRLAASIICDGFHLTADMARVIHRLKGPEGCILVTDAVYAATLPSGDYQERNTAITLEPSGRVVRRDGRSLAGSSISMNQAVAIFQRMTGVPLASALAAASAAPARLLDRPGVCAEIAPGNPANLFLFRPAADRLAVEQTILRGNPTSGWQQYGPGFVLPACPAVSSG